jgi:hypothetical protein
MRVRARVTYGYVEPTVSFNGRINHQLGVFALTGVRDHWVGPTRIGLVDGPGRLLYVFLTPAANDYAGTRGGKPSGNGLTNTARSAADNRHLAFQAEFGTGIRSELCQVIAS